MNRSKELLNNFDLNDHPLVSLSPITLLPSPPVLNSALNQTKFTTNDDNHVGDDYFLNSGDKIRYFLEVDAVDKEGKLTRDKSKAVNKIGHGEHHHISYKRQLPSDQAIYGKPCTSLTPLSERLPLTTQRLKQSRGTSSSTMTPLVWIYLSPPITTLLKPALVIQLCNPWSFASKPILAAKVRTTADLPFPTSYVLTYFDCN